METHHDQIIIFTLLVTYTIINFKKIETKYKIQNIYTLLRVLDLITQILPQLFLT